MKGLILKDIYNLRKNLKTITVMILLYFILAFVMDNSSFLSGIIVLLFSMMAITSFSYDDLAKWDKYALSLPISRKELVMSKYMLAIILSLFGSLISAIFTFLIEYFKKSYDSLELLLIVYLLFLISILFTSILIPLIFKFGVEKSRLMIIGVFAVPSGVIFALSKVGVRMPQMSTLEFLLKLSPLFLVLIFVLSYIISYKIYNKKEI